MLITSLKYFYNLVEEVAESSVSEDYWKHMQRKVAQLEALWIEVKHANPKDEIRETK